MLPGFLVAFVAGGVHGASESVMVIANLLIWFTVSYNVLMRRNKKKHPLLK